VDFHCILFHISILIMKKIEAALHTVDGYLISITRNTINGWYELQVGLPVGWVFDENDKISCEVIEKTEAGSLVKISPKVREIVIDDLLAFVQAIINTNEKIAKKEKQFTDKMENMKSKLAEEAKKFYTELDELKEKSFKTVNNEFVSSVEEKPKRGRPAKKTETKPVSKKTEPKISPKKDKLETVTEDTVDIEKSKN
jgi:hypothetical protein